MPLQEQSVAVKIAGGVDTKSDGKVVPSTKLRVLENGVFTKIGTIAKRTGYTDLSDTLDAGGSYESPRSLAARDNELILLANDRLYSYRDSTDTWSASGIAQSIHHTETPIARTATKQTDGDAATVDGVTVIAWEDSRGGVWWSVIEQASGRVLRAAEQLVASGQRVRVLKVGSVIHVYYAVPADSRIWVTVVNPSAYLATVTPAILVDDLSSANPSYDACPTTRTGGPAVMAWARSGGGFRVAYVDTSGVIGSPVTGHPSSATWLDTITGPIACSWQSWNPYVLDVGVLWVNGTTSTYRFLYEEDLLTSDATGNVAWTNASAMVRVACEWRPDLGPDGGGGALWMLGEEPSGGADRDNRVWIAYRSTVDIALAAPIRGHCLASRAFVDGAHGVYVALAHDVPFFPYVALLRLYTEGTVSTIRTATVGRLLVGVSNGSPIRGHLPSVQVDEDDARVHHWIAPYREQVDAASVSEVTGTPAVAQFTEVALKTVALDFDHPDAFSSAQLGRDLVIAGAIPLRYDGDNVAELGFHTAPDGVIVTANAGGGALTASSTYLYAFCYEETDAQGEIHAGPFSIGTLVVLAGGETRVTISVPTYRLTGKRKVRIGVFRSEANDTNAVDPALFRVSSLDPSAATGSNRYVDNDTTVDTVSFVDDMSDAAILTKERAYLAGGVLSNDPPPFGALVVGGKNRLFFSDPTQPLAVRFTQERRDGYAPEPAADLFTSVDPYGGPIVGLGILDDKVIIFKESAIYYFAGPGPLANPDDPNSPGFSPPTLVTSDVGCISAPSIAVTPLGLVFQSGKGIYLLDRGLSVKYVGAPVEAFNAQRVTNAALLSDRTQILFLCETGNALLYDYFHDQWSTFTNHAGDSAVLVDGVYHYLRADGRVFRESTTSYRDGSVGYTRAFETAWIKLVDHLQGWQWFYYLSLIGTYKGPHTLKVYTRFDFESGWGQPFVLNVDANYNPADYGEGSYGVGVYGGSADTHDTLLQKQLHLGQPGQAVSVRVEDFESTQPLGDSSEITELLFTGGVIATKALVGPARRS